MMKVGRWGVGGVGFVCGVMCVLSAAGVARAQGGVGFPVGTMPSPTAPAPTPAPAQPASELLPESAAPSPAPVEEEAQHGPDEVPPPEAERPQRFGEAGQIVISGQLSANLGFLTYDGSSASSSTASVEPAFQRFFADHLLVGGSVFLRYDSDTSALGFKASTTTFGASACFGADVPVSNGLSFEPVAGLGFWQASTSYEAAGAGLPSGIDGTALAVGQDRARTAVFVSLYAPLLVHPAAHLFLGLGPEAFRDLAHWVDAGATSSNPRRTFVGLSSIVGGWF